VPHRPNAPPVLLLVGVGDVAARVARVLGGRWRVLGLVRDPARAPALRAAGIVPLTGDLDRPETLHRLADVADRVLHLAPPPGSGTDDPRTAALLAALGRSRRVGRLVYVSTTGVYGDRGGAWVDETAAVRPQTDRARRRVDAERRIRAFGRRHGVRTTVLRAPGIWALDREGGDPRERIRRGDPSLLPADDVVVNHVHADDLARACVLALVRGPAPRVLNAVDDDPRPLGDRADAIAAQMGLPPPPRVDRATAAATLSSARLSFLSESRRVSNARLGAELGLRLLHPVTRVPRD
jgi:nucleoside-diphosphate-sugar epimerase